MGWHVHLSQRFGICHHYSGQDAAVTSRGIEHRRELRVALQIPEQLLGNFHAGLSAWHSPALHDVRVAVGREQGWRAPTLSLLARNVNRMATALPRG